MKTSTKTATGKAAQADKSLPPAEALTAAATPTKTDEANAAGDKPKAVKVKVEDDPALHFAYEQGRTARRARIAKADAPHGEGSAELKAWLKGYEAEEEANG